ncbi:hypothetical protein [Hymenobacter crusticola]|uniref:Uncharacterized protein n=1 Tax=Hymenobacter crusticola TaxID=1770526 RepID=A0A243W648_9BACT|nr:hypothetical protein [Hymenobacter crusticola]OUJ69507.1 hypothetical protein BXP70_26300 [Hymenobacter crusticola]
MEAAPLALSAGFVLLTGLTGWLFYRATHRSRLTLSLLVAWLSLQAGLSLNGFYVATPQALPPRLLLALLPPLLLLAGLLLTGRGRRYLLCLRLERLTLLHTIRLPVEIVLWVLSYYHLVPQLMTFEGRNRDLFSGLSAPVIYYLVFRRRGRWRQLLLGWNVVCLGLVLNILVQALLSVPGPLQRLAFEQPNVAVLYFPFVWLPSCLVPLVLLSHVAAFYQLAASKSGVNP